MHVLRCGSCPAWVARIILYADYARTYRFFRLNTLNYYGADACARFKSQCDCCEPLYMRFHIKEKKHQDEIKALVQSKDIDTMINGKRHDVHFDQVRRQCGLCTFNYAATKCYHARPFLYRGWP
jgi:hypothetical protein